MTPEQKRKRRNTIINAIVLIVTIGLTSWVLLKDQDLPAIFRELLEVRPIYLVGGAALVILFVCGESVIIKILFNAANVKVPLRHCIQFSFIGFFYSMITPSATGGQPMQIYYMRRRGIRIGTASVVLMLVTIQYKSVLIVSGLVLAILCRSFMESLDPAVRVFFTLGMLLNVVFVCGLAVLAFMPKFAHRLVKWLFSKLSKIRFLRLTEERLQRVENSMDVYQEASGLIRGHRKTIAFTQILTFVQRYCLFALTWLVYLSLDLRGAHFVPTIGRQAIVSIASDMLPTPGGLGFNEFVYMRIFTPVFGSELMTTVSLTMSRGFSYYFLVILSGIVTLGVHIYMTVRSHRRKAAEEQAVE